MSLPFLSYHTEPYQVTFDISKTHTFIHMSVPQTLLTTAQFPNINKTLNSSLPSIFQSTCYNDENLPFSEEVKRTETAHLFEHIFLEYLSKHDTRGLSQKKIYRGVTSWDWRKDPRGSFHIRLNVGTKDMLYLSHALEKTVDLFSDIISKGKKRPN